MGMVSRGYNRGHTECVGKNGAIGLLGFNALIAATAGEELTKRITALPGAFDGTMPCLGTGLADLAAGHLHILLELLPATTPLSFCQDRRRQHHHQQYQQKRPIHPAFHESASSGERWCD